MGGCYWLLSIVKNFVGELQLEYGRHVSCAYLVTSGASNNNLLLVMRHPYCSIGGYLNVQSRIKVPVVK